MKDRDYLLIASLTLSGFISISSAFADQPSLPRTVTAAAATSGTSGTPKAQLISSAAPAAQTSETEGSSLAATTVQPAGPELVKPTLAPMESTKPSEEKAPSLISRRRSSWENRALKSWYVDLQAGFPVSPIPALGIEVGTFLDPTWVLEADATHGKLHWWFINVRTNTVGVHLKHFVGNSFYVKGGGDYREISLGGPEVPYVGTSATALGEARSLAATFAFGNTWQWDHVNFGIEWLGLMLPFTTLKKHYSSNGLSPQNSNDLDFIWNRVGKTFSVSIFTVSLGASF